jgi:hypothetical protein
VKVNLDISWKLLLSAFIVLATTCGMNASAATQTVDLVVPENAAALVKFGAEEIRHALEQRGVKVATSRVSSSNVRIYLGQRGDSNLREVDEGVNVPDKPESYNIAVGSRKTIVVEGSDASGAFYGALDLAEQIGWARGEDFAQQIKPVSKSPYLKIRGVNMFVTTQDIDEPSGAFWSDEYWTGYLDMMARNRYNFLDIHGPCDAVTLTFPNGFSYFVSLPDFPEVGVGPERAARNMAQFRKVVRMAADRGIHVGYMNYEAPAPIGPWKTRRFGIDERWEPITQKFLEGPQLETYTREAVTSFLKQLPDLWMFGFRVGESGQPEDFYKKTYLEALKDAPTSLKVYVRTWLADPQKVRELASSTNHHLYIEPKYIGEQLGLPYQAALGGRQYPPSGSFENYTDYPRNYSIIWQIRAHGTHRVFYWGSPDFARRTVRSCKFGDGLGFSMEPMEAYGPAADYLHHNPKIDHSFYKWMFQREWLWHLTWGRTSYDPDTPEEVWRSEFARRFGAQAGPAIYKALVESSKIVPFVYAYHNVGLDHQDFAPEFETGDHAFGAHSRLWQGKRLVPYGGNNDDFLRVQALDRTAMADPVTYANNLLHHRASGKMTPFEAADYLGSAADAAEQAIQEAAKLNPSSTKEFDCIRRDIEATAALARYYRDRIRSATHFALYRQATDHSELTASYNDALQALTDWDRLSEVTSEHFGYVPEVIRMGVNQFRWRDEGRSLGVDLDQINNLEVEFGRASEHNRDDRTLILGHVPPFKLEPGRTVPITVTFANNPDIAHVYLFYRNAQQTGYTKMPLNLGNRFEGTWTGEIPADVVVPGHLEYYFEADLGRWGQYGGTLEHQPPYYVLVNAENQKPIITHIPPAREVRGNDATLEVQVQAASKVKSVRVYYKRMPAYYEWVKLEMEDAGNNHYHALVPLTPEGILYYFEAIDEDGNAANYPNFLERTPYFWINGWNPTGIAH